MAIYDYDNSNSKFLESTHRFCTSTSSNQHRPELSRAIQLIEKGEYQQAAELLKADTSDPNIVNVKAVLLLRLGRPEAAIDLLRRIVWDLTTMSLKPQVPVYVQLNFATALLLTGKVAACLQIVRAVIDPDNEQANDLLADIRSWEKSQSLLRWLDWKLCGIEHTRDSFPLTRIPGRFGWERKHEPAPADAMSVAEASLQSHDLAC